MAKVSTNSITSSEQDWGKDPSNNLPFSGEAIQKFIKDELNSKISTSDAETAIKNQITTQLFGGGTNNIVTDVDGNSETLLITSRTSEGTSTTKSLSIGVPDTNDRFVSIVTSLSNQYINVGGETKLAFGFVVTDYQGELIPNSFASVNLTLSKQGSTVAFYNTSLGSLSSASNAQTPNHEVDLTSILAENITGSASIIATLTVNYNYSYVDETGETKSKAVTKYSTTSITILSLTLATSINLANVNTSNQITIPYTVKGNGSKTVYLYKNGTLADTHSDITSASSSGVFTQYLTSGATNYQIVAETSAGDTVVRSSVFFFDLIYNTASPVVAIMVEDTTGTVQNDITMPRFNAPKFSDFKFSYFVYNPSSSTVDAIITTDEIDSDEQTLVSSVSNQTLERKRYTYSKKIKSSNSLRVYICTADCSAERWLYINPMASSINIELPTDSLQLNLDADGRSNEEVNPASWEYGDITTEFSDFNWQSNGWVNNTLVLQNGAKAVINFPLFQAVDNYPVTKKGCTFEILFKCANATLEEHDIISCYWPNNDKITTGLNITTKYVGVNTGEVTEYKDDDGKVTQAVETRVGSQYAEDTYYKYTFVIDPDAPGVGSNSGLCLGYLNGILSYIAPIPTSFINLDKLPITIDSTYADVYVKSIKYYDAPLTHDQCVDEYIVDQDTTAEIEELYEKNNVLAEDSKDNSYVSPQLLHSQGRGVMIISPSESQTQKTYLQDLNKSTDKKTYYGPFRVDYFAPSSDLNLGQSTVPTKGNEFNFTHTEAAIRIQGTTSTKRPRKNYRINFNKKTKSEKPAEGSFIVGGEVKDNFKYAMSQNALEVPICCLKVDYVDSSMTHNTGGAVVFNELTKNVAALRNPAQLREYKNSATDITTRVAIEGFPIDVFAADSVINGDYTDTLEDSNYTNLEYMGQYNFNNDKSSSGAVFGFDGAYTYDEDGTYNKEGKYQPICVEFLDNNADLCLFKTKFTSGGSVDDSATYKDFALALEVRAPADVTDQVADNGIDSLTEANGFGAYSYIPTQLKRVFNFIGECAQQVAKNNNISAYSLNDLDSDGLEALDWSCDKFIDEVQDYFNLSSVCAWYIWTDYLIAVDQRAKNMMMYTMDGSHWMFQYYDGDTMLGERNDCYLAYDYLTDRTTWDDAVKQYAMQGHDSWLWYLLRANFTSQRVIDGTADTKTSINLSSVCSSMRASGKFSADYFKQILNGQFVNNWSQRQYNYSQEYKYITPLTETGYPTDISTNFISTAQGSREAHRTYTLENRFSLLDSKYQAGDYSQDSFIYYASAGSTNVLSITSSIPYYFGWNTSNTSIREHQVANESNNYTVTLTITGNSANNPANVLGASRIKKLIFKEGSTWIVDSSKDVKLPNLETLSVSGTISGDLYLSNCPLLKKVWLLNSKASGLYGLENCSKLESINLSGTTVKSVKFADGAPISEVFLPTPTGIYLSNHKNLVYTNDDIGNFHVSDWSVLSELLINNCPGVDWEEMLTKLHKSSASTKYLRITGIDKTEDITWLDQFDGYYGLDADGGQVTTSAQLQGTLQLTEYVDDDVIEQYRTKYGNNGLLNIKQPEYTIIETDETIADETAFCDVRSGSTTNLDNNTGYRTTTWYQPSGHIQNILKRVHRYLGKVVTPGNLVDTIGMPGDTSTEGASFKTRDANGTMLVCQLADENSNYYNTGYSQSNTRRTATLDGLQGNGEVGVVIPKFWYKGINYNTPQSNTVSYRYTCYSSNDEKPGKSSETRVLSIAELEAQLISDGYDEGLYKEKRFLSYTNVANYVTDRITTSDNDKFNIYRINVEGYKKMRYPATIGNTCCLFTDADGKIMANSSGSVVGVGELYCNSAAWLYTGMGVITTIPTGAKYFYLALCKYVSSSSNITSDPCDVVLHKGSNYASGDYMTADNAKDWIADMEPDWVQSDEVWIAAGKAATDSTSLGLYSPFNGNYQPARGGSSGENDLSVKGNWFQYSMREAAANRGMMLIDYEASKLIAMLFMAKYGRRNSQGQLGSGSDSIRYIGNTRAYGIQDTCVPAGTSGTTNYSGAAILKDDGTYVYPNSPNFLGIEDVHGSVYEFLDRAYYANETAADASKIRITNPDLTTRRLYCPLTSATYPRSLVHGKYCDIAACSTVAGSNSTYYPDQQVGHPQVFTTWKIVRCIRRSDNGAYTNGGVFYLNGSSSVGNSYGDYGSRLMFRGNINKTTDIDTFMKATDWRG